MVIKTKFGGVTRVGRVRFCSNELLIQRRETRFEDIWLELNKTINKLRC